MGSGTKEDPWANATRDEAELDEFASRRRKREPATEWASPEDEGDPSTTKTGLVTRRRPPLSPEVVAEELDTQVGEIDWGDPSSDQTAGTEEVSEPAADEDLPLVDLNASEQDGLLPPATENAEDVPESAGDSWATHTDTDEVVDTVAGVDTEPSESQPVDDFAPPVIEESHRPDPRGSVQVSAHGRLGTGSPPDTSQAAA